MKTRSSCFPLPLPPPCHHALVAPGPALHCCVPICVTYHFLTPKRWHPPGNMLLWDKISFWSYNNAFGSSFCMTAVSVQVWSPCLVPTVPTVRGARLKPTSPPAVFHGARSYHVRVHRGAPGIWMWTDAHSIWVCVHTHIYNSTSQVFGRNKLI